MTNVIYAECRFLHRVITLSVAMIIVIMIVVVMLSVTMIIAIMIIVVMLSVAMIIVIMMIVVPECRGVF